MRNIQQQIDRVRAHLKSRRGRRDFAAHRHLVALQRVISGRSATHATIDEILQNVYTDDGVLPGRAYLFAPHSYFSFIEKSSVGGPYVVGIDRSAPEGDRSVVKAVCPSCDELIEITPNGADPKLTNKRQRLVLHPDKQKPGELCASSGKDV